MNPHVRWETVKAKRRAIDPGFDDPERLAAARDALHAFAIGFHLNEMREAVGKSREELAVELDLTVDEISRLEDGEVELMQVERIASYVAAMGGRLRLVADFGPTSTTFIDYTDLPVDSERHVA